MTLRKNHIFGWMAASALMLTASCSDDVTLDSTKNQDDNTVSFTISLQRQGIASRGDYDDDDPGFTIPERPYSISDGFNVDALIVAVYEVTTDSEGNEVYTLAQEFKNSDDPVGTITPGPGQSIINIGTNSWPLTIKFVVNPSKTYKAVFWAQSCQTDAFETEDLTNVRVRYPDGTGDLMEMPKLQAIYNNDELRDAFCAVSQNFSLSSPREQHIVLHRPFAQINVGTAGWDYEGAAIMEPPVVHLQSSIRIKGVAQYYNVLTGKAITKDAEGNSLLTDIEFKSGRMPAFIHYGNDVATVAEIVGDNYQPSPLEELLYVKRNIDPEYADQFWPYVGWDDFMDYRDKYLNEHPDASDESVYDQMGTEIYKYLSMCYVLVPEISGTTDSNGTVTYSSVLDEVEVEVYGKNQQEGAGEIFTINNVPVQKNWRTNILSVKYFTLFSHFYIDIVPTYCGDYDYFGWSEDGEWLNSPVWGSNNETINGGYYQNPDFCRYWNNYYYGNSDPCDGVDGNNCNGKCEGGKCKCGKSGCGK